MPGRACRHQHCTQSRRPSLQSTWRRTWTAGSRRSASLRDRLRSSLTMVGHAVAPHSSRNMLTRATALCRLLGRPRGLVVRHGSAARHPAHHVQVPGPEGEQDLLLCRPGLLRRHHRAGAHPQRLRGRHRHREQLGCHGARPRPRLHQAWHERRRGRCRHAHRHDRGRRQPPVLAEE